MSLLQSSPLYTRLLEKIPTTLPSWNQGNPSTKGDPRKSVKWIDVREPNDDRDYTITEINNCYWTTRVFEV